MQNIRWYFVRFINASSSTNPVSPKSTANSKKSFGELIIDLNNIAMIKTLDEYIFQINKGVHLEEGELLSICDIVWSSFTFDL